MDLLDPSSLNLTSIRYALIRQEDTIIFKLIERAQFPLNPTIYKLPSDGGVSIPGFEGSFLDFLIFKSEETHALVRRYESPDELPFTKPASRLPSPILKPLSYPPLIHDPDKRVNVNDQIMQFYLQQIVPALTSKASGVVAGDSAAAGTGTSTADVGAGAGVPDGDRGEASENYGSAAVADLEALQALSRRIHYGKFVAEVKYLSDKANMTALIKAKDVAAIEESITNRTVEAQVLARLARKAAAYGRDPAQDACTPAPTSTTTPAAADAKVDVDTVVRMYRDYVIPLTKKVEVDYLLQRLEYE
ncbi:chorismate mutase aro7 [Savitreella phatthalungensis]